LPVLTADCGLPIEFTISQPSRHSGVYHLCDCDCGLPIELTVLCFPFHVCRFTFLDKNTAAGIPTYDSIFRNKIEMN
jgi:hypothetical protein